MDLPAISPVLFERVLGNQLLKRVAETVERIKGGRSVCVYYLYGLSCASLSCASSGGENEYTSDS